MSAATKAFVIASVAGGLLLLASRGVAVPGRALTEAEVGTLARRAIGLGGLSPGVDPAMLTAIAAIESSFNPTAVRVELSVGDASVGLMQTLTGTAKWLYSIGYYWKPEPDFDALLSPETSMYFGGAFVHWLANRAPMTKGQRNEVIVRAYNGGPGNWQSSATEPYWSKYLAAGGPA